MQKHTFSGIILTDPLVDVNSALPMKIYIFLVYKNVFFKKKKIRNGWPLLIKPKSPCKFFHRNTIELGQQGISLSCVL